MKVNSLFVRPTWLKRAIYINTGSRLRGGLLNRNVIDALFQRRACDFTQCSRRDYTDGLDWQNGDCSDEAAPLLLLPMLNLTRSARCEWMRFSWAFHVENTNTYYFVNIIKQTQQVDFNITEIGVNWPGSQKTVRLSLCSTEPFMCVCQLHIGLTK